MHHNGLAMVRVPQGMHYSRCCHQFFCFFPPHLLYNRVLSDSEILSKNPLPLFVSSIDNISLQGYHQYGLLSNLSYWSVVIVSILDSKEESEYFSNVTRPSFKISVRMVQAILYLSSIFRS